MKKKLLYLTILIFSCFLTSQILFQPNQTIQVAKEALTLWRENLFPALFPFLVLGETLILLGIPTYLAFFFEKPFQLCFHLNGKASFVLFMSMISGFPSGPKYTVQLYKKGELSISEANRLLKIVHFSNPLFILGTVFLIIGNQKVTRKLFFAHYCSNFLLLFLTRKKERSTASSSTFSPLFKKQADQLSSFGLSFLETIQDGIETMLFMLGSITFFMLVSTCIKTFLPTLFLKVISTGIIDLTSGIFFLGTTSFSYFIKGLLATIFLTFGSFSVHLQVLNVLKGSPLSYRCFLQGRIISSFLASFLFCLSYFV